jgi:hypothetical protein
MWDPLRTVSILVDFDATVNRCFFWRFGLTLIVRERQKQGYLAGLNPKISMDSWQALDAI